MEWLLVVVVMGKDSNNRILLKNGDRNALKNEGRFFVFSWDRWNALSKGVDEINSWTVQGTKILYCDRLKAVVRNASLYFPLFSVLPALPLHQILSLPLPHMTQPAWTLPQRPRPKAFHFATGLRKDHLAFYNPVCKDLPALWRLEFQQRWKLGRRRHSKPDIIIIIIIMCRLF